MKSKAAARQVQQSMRRMRGATTALWDTIDGAVRVERKPHQAHDHKKRAIDALIARDGKIQASHFEVLEHLGQGDVGNVQVYTYTPVAPGILHLKNHLTLDSSASSRYHHSNQTRCIRALLSSWTTRPQPTLREPALTERGTSRGWGVCVCVCVCVCGTAG